MSSYMLAGAHGYIFRMRVPKELHSILGKQFLKKSLKTFDKLLATQKAINYAIQANELFDQLRGALPMSKFPFYPTTFTVKDVSKAADGSFSIGEFSTDDSNRSVEEEKELISHFFKHLSSMEATHATVPSSIQPVIPPQPKPTGPTISQAIDQYCTFQLSITGTKWDAEYLKKCVHPALNLLILALDDIAVSSITRENAVKVFDLVQRLPAGFTKSSKFRGEALNKVLEMDVKKQSPSTISGKMNHIQKFAEWLDISDLTPKNYFTDLNIVGKSGQEKPRVRFNNEDLRAMFSNRLFTKLEMSEAFMYWLPLIALHTGMRSNEICQLRSKDIFQKGDGYLMDVTDDFSDDDTDDGDDYKNRLKTGASKRHVPIHPKLIELGFLRFVEERENEIRLFDGLIEKDKRLSNVPSRWFNRSFRTEVGINNEEMKVRKDFHSFRHTAIDELKQARVELHVIKSIVGHSLNLGKGHSHDITKDTYGSDYDASWKLAAIKALDFSSVLTEVQPWSGQFSKGRRPRPKRKA